MIQSIPPRSGVAFRLGAGQTLKVIDPHGEQVADLMAASSADMAEVISSGRTFDYLEKIFLTKGDAIYSNRSRPLLKIVEDTVGRHDFLLAPCSKEMFRIIYGEADPHRGCLGNLAEVLSPFGIDEDCIPASFNIFMNVTVDGSTGRIAVRPPLSKAGDYIVVQAETDLVIGLTACSALQSNNYAFKPIHYQILA
jgi:uncharacterized protein YcgI (DUF1989 family)